MLAALVALAAVLCVAESRGTKFSEGSFTTELERRVDRTALERGRNLYMENGQCTGRIDKSLLCEDFITLGLNVSLTDYSGYPKVKIDKDLSVIHITRKLNEHKRCGGEVFIELFMLCKGILDVPVTDEHVLVPSV